MYLCIGFLAFLAFTLANAHYHHLITLYAQDGERESNRQPNTIEFDLPHLVDSGWCRTPEQNERKIISHSAKNVPWNCTFNTIINRTAHCITRFHSAEQKSKYFIKLNMEKNTTFIIESNKTEAQINIISAFFIDLGSCTQKGNMVTKYYADSMITLDHAGKWICRFYIQKKLVPTIIISLRSSDHNRMYEMIDGKGTSLISQEPQDKDKMNTLLTLSEIKCYDNNLSIPVLKPDLSFSYISLEPGASSETRECKFNKITEYSSCTYNVQGALPSNDHIPEWMDSFGESRGFPPLPDSMTHVLLFSIGGAVLVIIMLICGICYYKHKVKKFKANAIPPNIICRAPFETPPEIVYDCVYSHPAGLKRPGIQKEKKADQKQLIDVTL